MRLHRDTDPTDEEPGAQEIVENAAARVLGRRPRLRELAAIAWSAFLGASVSLLAVLLVPDGWFDAPLGFERLAVVFVLLWILAMIPAASQALLSRRAPGKSDAG